MNATAIRLALRLHRFEIGVLGGLTVGGVVLLLLVCSWLDGMGFGGACLAAVHRGQGLSSACIDAERQFEDAQRSLPVMVTQAILFASPFLLAALAGVAFVGRELERGTSRLAWSLAPSRWTWFAGRLLPLLAVVTLVALMGGLGLDRFAASMNPGMDPWASLQDFGNRGVDLAARAVFAFAIAVLVGAALARVLPALLVAILVVAVGIAGGSNVHGRILQSEAIPMATQAFDPANLTYDSGFLAPDGEFVSWDRVQAMAPPSQDPNTPWTPPYPEATLAVPGSRYPLVVGREVAALLGASAVALALAYLVVRRARPG